MNLLKKLMGHDDEFFDLLEASAREARGSVRLLVDMMKNPETIPSLEQFMQTRRKEKRITEQIAEELCRKFEAPFEREDIEALSVALYRIPKMVERFSEKILISRQSSRNHAFPGQLAILEEATETVATMVRTLRNRPGLPEVKAHNDKLHSLERDGDKLVFALVKDLYSGRHGALEVIVTMDLSDTLEQIIDRCRDAGNVIFQMVLKYS